MYLIIIITLVIFLYFLKKYINGGVNKLKEDLSNKIIIVTGSSSGIGKETALNLIKSNGKVIYGCRNEEKVKKAMEEIPINLKKNAEFIKLDLCSLKSIINFSNIIKNKYPKIDILINNAGAQPRNFIITEDNLESSIQGNFIGPFLLSLLLLNHFNANGKIINVSSVAHKFYSFDKNILLILDNFKEIEKKYFDGNYIHSLNLYSLEKLFILYGTFYIKDIIEKKNLNCKICALHPGVVNSNFMIFLNDYPIFHFFFKLFYYFFVFFTKNSFQGAQTQLYLSYLDYNQFINGGYYSDRKLSNVGKNAKNEELKKIAINWVIQILKNRLPNHDLIQNLSLI